MASRESMDDGAEGTHSSGSAPFVVWFGSLAGIGGGEDTATCSDPASSGQITALTRRGFFVATPCPKYGSRKAHSPQLGARAPYTIRKDPPRSARRSWGNRT